MGECRSPLSSHPLSQSVPLSASLLWNIDIYSHLGHSTQWNGDYLNGYLLTGNDLTLFNKRQLAIPNPFLCQPSYYGRSTYMCVFWMRHKQYTMQWGLYEWVPDGNDLTLFNLRCYIWDNLLLSIYQIYRRDFLQKWLSSCRQQFISWTWRKVGE